jgi:hypothetical protein
MQIHAVVLFSYNGERRILPLKTGTVNIITGKSKTGKSVIGNIIDYCFGGTSCNIAEGDVRDRVAWYGLHLEHSGEYLFIARENPPQDQSSTNKCCYLIGAKEIPENISTMTPITNEGIENILSDKIGISENIYRPPINQSREPLSANIRHALYYCIQNQDELASQKILFHRQSEDFMTSAIKNTLPYFLGVINENALALESERTLLKRESNIIKRAISEVEMLKGSGLYKATELLSEAREVGLLPSNVAVNLSDYNDIRKILENICRWKPIDVEVAGMDKVSLLQSHLRQKNDELDALSIDIRNAEEFSHQIKGYLNEVGHQKSRLESIGLFEVIDFDPGHCPLCSEPLKNPLPVADDIRNAIKKLSDNLSIVNRENPHLHEHIEFMKMNRQKLREDIKSLGIEINAIYNENEAALKLKDLNNRRSRIIGRISIWLESVIISDKTDEERRRLALIESKIYEISKQLDKDDIEERKLSTINQISAMISEWAKVLDLEHSEHPYRFDLNKLTVMVDRNRPVPLQQLGSGANWLGCHLVTLFAIHTFMHMHKRPFPGFLFLDQPSQVFFPPETNNSKVDNQEIRKIYRFVFDRIKELYPNMQVIIVDHADIDEEYFQEAVVEKWWDDNSKLVPTTWQSREI